VRLFEVIIPILLSIYLLWPHPRPFTIRVIPILALVLTLLHLALEGYRWQMIPLYALTLVLTILPFFVIDLKPPASYLTLRLRSTQSGAFILLILSTALPIVLPVPTIPLRADLIKSARASMNWSIHRARKSIQAEMRRVAS